MPSPKSDISLQEKMKLSHPLDLIQNDSHTGPQESCNVAPILVALILGQTAQRFAIGIILANHWWTVCDP